MKVEVAVLADYANTAEAGKLNVMGMFDRIWSPKFPSVHPMMVLALRLRLDFEDRERTHTIGIRLEDEDGRQLSGGNGEVKVGPIPAGHREVISQILPFVNTIFPKEGEYSFTLTWNGVESSKVYLTLATLPESPPDLRTPA